MKQRPMFSLRNQSITVAAFLPILITACAGPADSVRTFNIDTAFLKDLAETRGYSSGRPSRIQLTPDGEVVLFLRSGPRDVTQSLYEMNVATGAVRCLLRAEDLLAGRKEVLTPEERAARERSRESRQGLVWYQLSDDGSHILTGLGGKLFVIRRADERITALPESDAGPARDARFSPDARFVACIRGYDLHVIDIAAQQDRALTSGGTQDLAYGIAEFVAAEEMDRRSGYWWTADSQSIAYEAADQRDVPTRYIADPLHPTEPAQPWRYPNAGAKNARVRLGIVSITGGDTRWVAWDVEKYPYLAGVQSGRDTPLTIFVQSRDQEDAVLYRVDAATGTLSPLLTEHDDAWINLHADMPRWLADGSGFLWISDRTGEDRLEFHAADGSVKNVIAPPDARLDGVVMIDQARREVVLRASPTPIESQLYRAALDGLEWTRLTTGLGEHGGTFSKDGNAWVHSATLADGRQILSVQRRDADTFINVPGVAEEPPFVTNIEWTTVEVDGRSHQAALIRPRDFKRGRRYPVIDYVYGGPGSAMVTSASRMYLRQQWIADQGFIIVMADGRGTPGRGRSWERAIKNNLIDIPLADQAAVVTALGKRYSEIDLQRVGIYGWSFGGYFSAMAVLRRSDLFQAGVAGAPVVDWHDYDTHYTERYMGLPDENPAGYKVCDATTYADQLRRPLLLIHGTTDDNVYFQHTIRLHDALFRAGKDHELLALSGFTHMVPDPVVTSRLYERIVRFFKVQLGDPH